MSDKPKKKITWKQWQRRTMLIILAVVAVFVAAVSLVVAMRYLLTRPP